MLKELFQKIRSGSDEKVQGLIDAYPPRPGMESKLCFGAFFIDSQPSKTLQMTDKPDAILKWDLSRSWDITDTASAKGTLAALEAMSSTRDIDLSTLFTPDMAEPLIQAEKTNNYNSPEAKKAYERFDGLPLNVKTPMWSLAKKWLKAKYGEVMTVTCVRAWDIERMAGIARKCYFCGLITEDECYQYLEKAESLAKQYYGSWREYLIGYFLGRGICYSEENFGQWEYTGNKIMNDKDSIWNSYEFPRNE